MILFSISPSLVRLEKCSILHVKTVKVTIARLEISVIGLSEVWNLCCEVNPALCSYWVIKILKVLPDSGNFRITLFTEYFIHKAKQNSEKLF